MLPVDPSALNMLSFLVPIKLPFEFLTKAVPGGWVPLLIKDLFASVWALIIWAWCRSADCFVPATILVGLKSVISFVCPPACLTVFLEIWFGSGLTNYKYFGLELWMSILFSAEYSRSSRSSSWYKCSSSTELFKFAVPGIWPFSWSFWGKTLCNICGV